MKKLFPFLVALFILTIPVEANAQGFLQRLGKVVESEVRKVEKKKKKKKQEQEQPQSQNNSSSETPQETDNTNPTESAEDRHLKILIDKGVAVRCTPSTQSIGSSGPTTGVLRGHEWVDLGLPSGTRWATCNVGASKPEQSGGLYAWGETSTKTFHGRENSKTCGKTMTDISGNATYDVATSKWGKGWRMPTKEEFEELLKYCNYDYVKRGNLYGHLFTHIKTKRTIFLPSTGSKEESSKIEYPTVCGLYWTSTPLTNSYNTGAHQYHFGAALGEMGVGERASGYGVRPVTDCTDMNQIPASGSTNGHEWVDLGLPSGTKWATTNLGASTSENFGNRFCWGQIVEYEEGSSNKFAMDKKKLLDISGNATYDAATAQWGANWTTPTYDQFYELMHNCTWEFTTLGRISGCKVISKINGNYIFLPFEFGNKYERYWTSTSKDKEYYYDGDVITLDDNSIIISMWDRSSAYPIRPVTK